MGKIAQGTSCSLMITLPDKLWLGRISREYQYYQYEIKSFIPISQEPYIGNSLISITGNKIEVIKQQLDSFISLKSYFIMDESPTHITLNTQTHDQLLLKALVNNMIIVNFPIKIDKGVAFFNISCSRTELDKFLSNLDAKGIEYSIRTIENYSNDEIKNLLTPKQYKTYQKAREFGYYDVPRKITLTELAKELGVAKSSLSSMLQRIHNTLLAE